MDIPDFIPEPGFYYHYKHTPADPVNTYAYEVLGTGYHTEKDCRPEDINLVVYRPLYPSFVYEAGRFFDIRPLGIFTSRLHLQGEWIPRYTKITDPTVIAKLTAIRDQMYLSTTSPVATTG